MSRAYNEKGAFTKSTKAPRAPEGVRYVAAADA